MGWYSQEDLSDFIVDSSEDPSEEDGVLARRKNGTSTKGVVRKV